MTALITQARGRGERRKAFKLIDQRKAAMCRTILPGFPKHFRFTSLKEVDEYFGGDRIQCLLCGKWFKSFSKHLTIHGVSPREYKLYYNIPVTYGLTSAETRKKYVEGGKLSKGQFSNKRFLGKIDYEKMVPPPDYVRRRRKV